MAYPAPSPQALKSPVQIRWGKATDAREVCSLVQKHGPEDFNSPTQVIALYAAKRPPFLVATHANQVVACVVWVPEVGDNLVWSVVVAPGHRRKGIGRGLLKALWKLPASYYQPVLAALAREHDLVAQKFLKGVGFRCVKTLDPCFDCPPEAGYLFTQSEAKLA